MSMFLKSTVSALAFVGSLISGAAFADTGKLVPSPVEKLLIPNGFDDNDNAEVIVHGHYRDSCFKTGPTKVKVDHARKVVTIFPYSIQYTDGACADMIVPFVQSVKVGILNEGNYKVQVGNSNVKDGFIPVAHRVVETPDDFLYAPVDDAYIEQQGREQTLVLRGTYPRTYVGCAIISNVRAHVEGELLVVQPVMELLSDADECRRRKWKPQFVEKVELQQPLGIGDNVIHVRVLSGNSLNKLVYISR